MRFSMEMECKLQMSATEKPVTDIAQYGRSLLTTAESIYSDYPADRSGEGLS